MEEVVEQAPRSNEIEGSHAMHTPEDVQAMLKLASMGWGAKRIAAELGCSRNTVKRYLRQGGWQPYQAPTRAGVLDEHAAGPLDDPIRAVSYQLHLASFHPPLIDFSRYGSPDILI